VNRPAKILVVDDESIIRDSLCEWLEDIGYDVAVAENGARALELAARDEPDVVIALTVKDIDITRHSASPNDTTLTAALDLGRRLGLSVPKDENIAIIAVGISPGYFFSEECSPAVEKAIPVAAEMVMKELRVSCLAVSC